MNIYLSSKSRHLDQEAHHNFYPERTIIANMQGASKIKNFNIQHLQPKTTFTSKLDPSFIGSSTSDKINISDTFTLMMAPWVSGVSPIGKQFISSALSTVSSVKSIFNNALNEPLRASFWRCLAAACLTAIAAAAIFIFCPPLAILPFAEAACWLFGTTAIMLLNNLTQHSDSVAAKAIRCLHATIIDVNCSIASAFLFPATLIPSYHDAKGNLHGRPILMINGYLGFGATWHVLRERLAKAGCGPIYTMNIGSFESIAEYAACMQTKVKKIQNETGRKDIALICHSKGGLVGSYYATQLAPSDGAKVTDIVTIAAPLAGTPYAKYCLGQDAKEMNPEHPFNADLRKEIAKHPEIRFFNIASEADTMVPLQSALLGTDLSRQKVFKDLGHLGLVFSSRVANQILTWLNMSI